MEQTWGLCAWTTPISSSSFTARVSKVTPFSPLDRYLPPDPGDIRNFNISVGLTNEFMDKVSRNDPSPWKCKFTDKDGTTTFYNPRRISRGPASKPRFEIDLSYGPLSEQQREEEAFVVQVISSPDEGNTGGYYRLKPLIQATNQYTQYQITEVVMTARELFDEILSAAHKNGEPGCVFLDRVNETNPLPALGRIESSNPCGEQFLHDGDVRSHEPSSQYTNFECSLGLQPWRCEPGHYGHPRGSSQRGPYQRGGALRTPHARLRRRHLPHPRGQGPADVSEDAPLRSWHHGVWFISALLLSD